MNRTILLSKVLLRQNLATMLGLDGSGSGRRKRSQRSSLLATGIIALVLLVLTGVAGYAVQLVAGPFGFGRPLLCILLGGTGIMMFMLAIPSVLGAFYASSDIDDLLPMPFSGSSIVAAKSAAALISSYVFPTMILLGPLVGWGISAGEGAFFWLATVAIVLFAPLMPFSYAAILSMILARFSSAMRRKDVVATLSTVISIVIVVLSMLLQMYTRDDSSIMALVQLRGLIEGLIAPFPSYGFAVSAVDGSSVAGLLAFIGISVASVAVFIAIAQLVYLRTVTSLSSSGGKERVYAGESGKASGSIEQAVLRTDIRRTFRTPALWLNQIIMPVLVMVICCISVTMKAVPELSKALETMDPWGIALTAVLTCSLTVFIVGMVGSANRLSGTVVSREGSNWDFMKVIPVSYERLLRVKMLPGMVVNALLLLIPLFMILIPLTVAGLPLTVLVCTMLISIGLIVTTSCLSLSSDTANHRVAWGNDGEVDNKTVGGGAGLLRGIIASVIYCALPLVALTGLPWEPVLIASAAVVIAASLLVGRIFVKKAARNLADLEK